MKKIYTLFFKGIAIALALCFTQSLATAQSGTHLSFDGSNDYVQCGSILTPSYTKEAWVNLNNYVAFAGNIISGGESSGRHAFWLPNGILSSGHNGTFNAVVDNIQLSLNTWYHVAVTYDAATTTMKLYRNGMLVATNTAVPDYLNGQNVTLGSYEVSGSPVGFMDGSIDEVRIWNSALTAAEINNRKNCELTGMETGLVAYYKFNQGTGGGNNAGVTTLLNSSPTPGIDGTLNNFALMGTSSNWLSGSPVAASPSIATANISQTLNVAGTTGFSNFCADLITSVTPNGASPLSGSTTAQLWFEAAQPASFVKRHYQLMPASNAATATARVTLYFTQQEFDDFNAVNTNKLPTAPNDLAGKNRLVIEKRSGVSNDGTGLPASYTGAISSIDPADADVVWNAGAARWEVAFDVTGFSGFFVKSFVGALPVTLINFSGTQTGSGNVLTWKSAGEINVTRFEIERSSDGRSFRNAGTVAATGTGSGYTFTDADNIAGKLYYRLKIVDNNSRFAYSNIIILDAKPTSLSFVYPNPAADITTLQIKDNALLNTKATLTDMSGKVLQLLNISQKFSNINLQDYRNGLYLLRLQNGEVIKLIKQ